MPSIATSRILHEPELASAPNLYRPWIWPLPQLDGVAPRVLAHPDGALDTAELGYSGRSSSPDFVPVFAAREGVIAYAGTAGGSPMISLDHAGGWSTQYAELAQLRAMPTDRFRRRRKVRVRAGDVLGYVHPDALRLRFGLAQLVDGEWSFVDPAEAMHTWSRLPWFSQPTTSVALPCAT